VLPVGNTFLHVEPLYIQASEARMPQLKKVILAIGNTLIYRDTYEQALGDLNGVHSFCRGNKKESQPGRPLILSGQ
jgi:uncharacterized membrane protein (UPF0182 family)